MVVSAYQLHPPRLQHILENGWLTDVAPVNDEAGPGRSGARRQSSIAYKA
jgi:hypothetical protein